ncbi:MAG: hypothetical protein WHT46_07110 [Candidatus Geothermincolales bacterium]
MESAVLDPFFWTGALAPLRVLPARLGARGRMVARCRHREDRGVRTVLNPPGGL